MATNPSPPLTFISPKLRLHAGNTALHATLSVSLSLGSHFTKLKEELRGLLDCEQCNFFLLSHSRAIVRVRGERRAKPRGTRVEAGETSIILLRSPRVVQEKRRTSAGDLALYLLRLIK